MVKLQALLLCDLVVKGPDGKTQLQGIFDVIFARTFPAQHRSMFLYFRFYVDRQASNGEDKIVVALKRPSGVMEKLPPLAIQLSGNKVEGHVQLQGLPLFEEGIHTIEVYFNKELAGAYDLTVTRLTPVTVGEQHATVH